jgi:hypothetical protein
VDKLIKANFLGLNFGDLFLHGGRYWVKTSRTAATHVSGGEFRSCTFHISDGTDPDYNNPEILFIPHDLLKPVLDKLIKEENDV